MLLSSLIVLKYEVRVLFVLILLSRVLCTLLKLFSPYQALHLFSTRVLSEIFLTPCAILLIVPEAVCCGFHQVSSHLVKFMFNSFHLQSECCPNYIILIPSLSCFNRSVVVIDLYRSLCISFQPECLMYFLSIVLVIHSFANSKVHMVFLVSLFYRCASILLLIR